MRNLGCTAFIGELFSEGRRAQERKSMACFEGPWRDSPAKERSRKPCLNRERGELDLLRMEESVLPIFFTIDSPSNLFTSSF